jgi:membrane-bound serine protease (ClpP class)
LSYFLSRPIAEKGAGRKRKLLSYIYLTIWLVGIISLLAGPALAQTTPGAVSVLEIEGIINPPVANYVGRAMEQAIENEASLVVIVLDTPGGLDTSMRQIMQSFWASPVPVAVYVAPSGARAASAGLFLLVSSHVAAMAPGTNTGSAHPVGLGGETDEVTTAKVVEDAAATIRSLALDRGRNAEWAERAVRESVSATETEALELNVIEIIAANLDDLLAQIDGRTVQTAAGEITIDIAGAPIVEAPMNFAENFLHVITDPNIAFILLSVGSIGLLAELYNPGALFPGITGAIALILAFFSLGNLPTNWAGVALILFAIGLTIAELYIEGFGVLGIGALVSFVLGALILFRPFRTPSPVMPVVQVNPFVIAVVTLSLAGFLVFVLSQVMRIRKAPISMGVEHFTGQIARAHSDINPTGRVWFDGTTWYAELADGAPEIHAGSKVRILRTEGLTLVVEALEPPENALPSSSASSYPRVD